MIKFQVLVHCTNQTLQLHIEKMKISHVCEWLIIFCFSLLNECSSLYVTTEPN
jgi:hypothetical protein